jgi:hypothetical protein
MTREMRAKSAMCSEQVCRKYYKFLVVWNLNIKSNITLTRNLRVEYISGILATIRFRILFPRSLLK